MSKYSRVKTSMKNKIAIERAMQELCKQFNKPYQYHENGVALRMYTGDTNLARLDGGARGQRMANWVIRKEHLENFGSGDLGIVYNPETQCYDVEVDRDYGMGYKIADKLAQFYGIEVAKITAAEMGLTVTGVVFDAQGNANLEVELPEYQYAQTYV
jgi:hypothetical protein